MQKGTILLLLVCIAMILVAGCVGSTNSPIPTATTPAPQSSDPIIGSWMTIGDSTLYYIFLPDGAFQSGELRSPGLTLVGRWSKTDENQYVAKIKGVSDENFVYIPSGDYIYWTIAPGAHATRYDKV